MHNQLSAKLIKAESSTDSKSDFGITGFAMSIYTIVQQNNIT